MRDDTSTLKNVCVYMRRGNGNPEQQPMTAINSTTLDISRIAVIRIIVYHVRG